MKELLYITVLAILVRAIEICPRLVKAQGQSRKISVQDFYELLNFHGALSLGIFGYVITLGNAAIDEMFITVAVIFVGAFLKGGVSKNCPITLRPSDWDSFFGIYFPNGLAVGLAGFIHYRT